MDFLIFLAGFAAGAAAGYYKWGRKQSTPIALDDGPNVGTMDGGGPGTTPPPPDEGPNK